MEEKQGFNEADRYTVVYEVDELFYWIVSLTEAFKWGDNKFISCDIDLI